MVIFLELILVGFLSWILLVKLFIFVLLSFLTEVLGDLLPFIIGLLKYFGFELLEGLEVLILLVFISDRLLLSLPGDVDNIFAFSRLFGNLAVVIAEIVIAVRSSADLLLGTGLEIGFLGISN